MTTRRRKKRRIAQKSKPLSSFQTLFLSSKCEHVFLVILEEESPSSLILPCCFLSFLSESFPRESEAPPLPPATTTLGEFSDCGASLLCSLRFLSFFFAFLSAQPCRKIRKKRREERNERKRSREGTPTKRRRVRRSRRFLLTRTKWMDNARANKKKKKRMVVMMKMIFSR